MRNRAQSYSEPGAERQFASADKKKIQKIIYSIIIKKGPKRAAKILAGFFQEYVEEEKRIEEEKKAEEEKRVEEEKKTEEEKRQIVEKSSAFKIIAGLLITGVVLTYAFEKLDDLWIWKDILKIGSIVLEAVMAAARFARLSHDRKENEGVWGGVAEFLKDARHQLGKASELHFLGLVLLVILAADGIAQYKPFEYAGVFCSGGCDALVSYIDHNNNVNENVMTAEVYLTEASISREMKLYLTGEDETMIQQL
ncbi:MAG: hypothetical protein NC121_16835, partial [Blautia sp.]|nr:hypothetical protein [Blautia sp.]